MVLSRKQTPDSPACMQMSNPASLHKICSPDTYCKHALSGQINSCECGVWGHAGFNPKLESISRTELLRDGRHSSDHVRHTTRQLQSTISNGRIAEGTTPDSSANTTDRPHSQSRWGLPTQWPLTIAQAHECFICNIRSCDMRNNFGIAKASSTLSRPILASDCFEQ